MARGGTFVWGDGPEKSRGDNVKPPQPTTEAERAAMLERRMAREAREREAGSGSGPQIGGGRITNPLDRDARRIIPRDDSEG